MSSKPFTIGLIGFGNIGSGVVRTLAERASLITSRLPRPIVLKTIADRDTTTQRDAPYRPEQLIGDAYALINDPEIDAVIELVGGIEPARTFVEKALRASKHVVTANKALLALAEEKGVGLLYEAAVGGGIPIIRTLQQGLSANELTSVQGILNGTCNYILTRMGQTELPFDQALEEAKNLGYAEPDPTYDIEGYDTAHKIAILASLAFGMDIRFEDVYTQGITQLEPVDIQYAREMGYTIKLLGIAKRAGDGAPVEVRVHPTLIPSDTPLGKVNGVFNGIQVAGEPIGTTMYYGRGAGAGATSSAVVSDLMALAADNGSFARWRDARLGVKPGAKAIKPMDELETHYYIRFTMADRPGAMATIGRALADQGVSIRSMIQHQSEEAGTRPATISIVTHLAREKSIQAAIAQIEQHEMSASRAFVLRVEE